MTESLQRFLVPGPAVTRYRCTLSMNTRRYAGKGERSVRTDQTHSLMMMLIGTRPYLKSQARSGIERKSWAMSCSP